MKNLLYILFTVSILLSCSSTPEFPAGRWLLESNKGDAYITITDTLISITPIEYQCDTIASTDNSFFLIDTSYCEGSTWIILPNLKNIKKRYDNSRLEIQIENSTSGYLTLYSTSAISSELYGKLSKPSKYFPNYDELDSGEKTLRWAYYTVKSDITEAEILIKQISEDAQISPQAQNLLNYIDSLEMEMISSLDSEYDLECIHRDTKAYRYLASDYLVNDPSNPTNKYFSALGLKRRLSSYYKKLDSKEFAQDMYDFEFVQKSKEEVRPNRETWEIQEFFHVPYYNVILTFRQIKLAIFQIEKYKDLKPSWTSCKCINIV